MRDARHREIGKRFRQVAAEIKWENLRNPFVALHEAHAYLQEPAKIAGREGAFSRVEKMANLNAEAKTQGGRVVRAAFDVYRQLNVDSDRDRFQAQLEGQKVTSLSSREIQQIIEPQMAEAELGARLVCTMDTFLSRLRDPVESRYQPIKRLALRFKDALFSELKRLEVAGVCKECGQTFVMTSQRKRFCSLTFEDHDCGARARRRRSYKKHARPAMTRSESARNAARVRWAKRPESAPKK